MKIAQTFISMVLVLAFTSGLFAKESAEAHRKEVIAQHQAMAKAHTDAAACIAKAKDDAAEKACHSELQKACKGVGIGKYCGMKHGH